MDMASSFFEFLHVNKHKTFRPKKRFPMGTLRYHLHKQAQATLHSGVDLRQAVRLPPGDNLDDWLAVHNSYPGRDLENEFALKLSGN